MASSVSPEKAAVTLNVAPPGNVVQAKARGR
jgi:hypothetical protein